MSISTGGAGGNKRVVIEFIGNDTQLTTVLTRVNRNLKTAMEGAKTAVAGVGTTVNTTSTSMTGLGTAVETTATKTNTLTGALGNINSTSKTTTSGLDAMASATKNVQGGLDSTNTLAGKSSDSIGKLGDAGEKTGGKMDKLKEAFAGNRGLIYSMGTIFGTITGVVAELQLLDDANAQVAEATDKLNKLQAEGKQGTTEYTQAQQQLEKANRFASFTMRNLSLAVANFVPEILLLTTTLAKGDGIIGKLTGSLGKVKGAMASLPATIGAVNASSGALLATLGKIAIVAAGFEVLGRAWAGALQAGNPFFTKLHEIGQELEKIPVIGPALKAFGDIMNSIFLPDLVAKEKERLDALNKSIKDSQNALSGLNTTAKAYIPTSQLFTQSTQSVWKEGAMVTQTYTKTANAVNMYGVEQQKSAETSKIATAGFIAVSGSVSTLGNTVKTATGPTTTLEETLYKMAHTQSDTTKTTQSLESQLAHLAGTTGLLFDETTELPKAYTDTVGPMTDLEKISELSTQTFDQFMEQINVGIPAQKRFHDALVMLATKYPQVKDAAHLTTEELKLQILAAAGDEDAIQSLTERALKDGSEGFKELEKSSKGAAKALEDFGNDVESGLDKIVDAFHRIKGDDADLGFEKNFDKANKAFDKFLTKIGTKLSKGGIEGGKEFIVGFAAKGTEGMDDATKKIFDPVFAWIEKHKNEPPDKFMQGFLAQLATYDPKLAAAIQGLLPEGTKLTGFGNDVGDNIIGGITDAFEGFGSGGGLDFGENGEGGLFGPVVEQSKTAADLISKQKYEFPPPDITAALRQFDNVVRRMLDIGKMKAVPIIDVNIEKFIKGGDTVVKRLQSINKMKAVPKIDVNIEKALKGMDTVVRRLQDINKMHADPKVTIHQTTVKETVTRGVGGHHATLSDLNANAYASGNVNITLINTDEYGEQKKRKFKAALGKGSYVYGA